MFKKWGVDSRWITADHQSNAIQKTPSLVATKSRSHLETALSWWCPPTATRSIPTKLNPNGSTSHRFNSRKSTWELSWFCESRSRGPNLNWSYFLQLEKLSRHMHRAHAHFWTSYNCCHPPPTLSFHAKPSEDIAAHLLHAGNKIRWAAPRRRKDAVPSETWSHRSAPPGLGSPPWLKTTPPSNSS